jgi:recombinational DNA repair ATPase RecF
MRLVAFSVQKYRSVIAAEKLQLRDLTVLVGPNNEGKSNILQALVTGMGYLSSRRNARRFERGSFARRRGRRGGLKGDTTGNAIIRNLSRRSSQGVGRSSTSISE